jgi:hypothetical protein
MAAPSASAEDTARPVVVVDALSAARARRAAKKGGPAAAEVLADPVKKTIEEFFSQPFDPRRVLPNQSKKLKDGVLKLLGNDPDSWVDHMEEIAENFHVMEWWECWKY